VQHTTLPLGTGVTPVLHHYEATTTIALQLIGDADPMGSIRRYGEHVLPALRGDRATA
jgi:hypothetical protein